MSMELTPAKDARVGFLSDDDKEYMELDPLAPGHHALFIASPDWDKGVTLVGTLPELRGFAAQLAVLLGDAE